ncbi:MAG TPA: ABC transporter ATP-binding protein [Roseiarcus sp.]|jgi:branched-chain amino acid transport system ATP-binding protein|nr:ABC transporter ATP-binding protein [Roseiarcus sp.]
MSALQVDNLVARHGLLQAVRGVSFRMEKGETLALVGANGAGKTTLLRAIAGAHPLHSGRVFLDGADLGAARAHERTRRGVALVPEGRRLFAGMSVEDNLRLAGGVGRSGLWTIDTVLETFPNLKARRKALAASLSGGEQQAAAIGRALMTNPEVLLLDEVSLGLSPVAVERVYSSLETLMRSGVTIVLVEQDLNRALRVASRVICMLEGRFVAEGKASEMTREEITAAYFGLNRAAPAGVSP